MKPTIWHPEEKDAKVNEYLARVNRASYRVIFMLSMGLFCRFVLVFLMASF